MLTFKDANKEVFLLPLKVVTLLLKSFSDVFCLFMLLVEGFRGKSILSKMFSIYFCSTANRYGENRRILLPHSAQK